MTPESQILLSSILGGTGALLSYWAGWRARGDVMRIRGGVIGRPPLIFNEGPVQCGSFRLRRSEATCGGGEITLAEWEAMRTPFAKGRIIRGNGNGSPTTPKPGITPKPQFPPPQIIREDFLP